MTSPSAPTVDLPVIGVVPRKWLWYGAGSVAVLAVGYAYWRSRQSGGQVTTLTYDPASGTATAGGGYTNPVPGADGGPGLGSPEGPGLVLTNDAWVRTAVQDLIELGYDPGFSSQALGKYLAGALLTQDELNLVRTAWGLRGKPPEGAPEPRLAPPPPASTPPPAAPAPAPAPVPIPSVSGLRVTSQTKGWISLSWSPAPGISRYRVYHQHEFRYGDVSGTIYNWNVPNVTSDNKFAVAAIASNGHVGPISPWVPVRYTQK